MSIPSYVQLNTWAMNYVQLWNAGEREAWISNWRTLAPGEVQSLDADGALQKNGFDECCEKPFDLFQPTVRFRLHPGSMFIRGNEVAWILASHYTEGGEQRSMYSLETYRFESDGSALIRTYYKAPPHSAGKLGALFRTYLPEYPDGT